MARVSLQSGKLVMAACQEAGDRCAAVLIERSAGLRRAWVRSTVTSTGLGAGPGDSRQQAGGGTTPQAPLVHVATVPDRDRVAWGGTFPQRGAEDGSNNLTI